MPTTAKVLEEHFLGALLPFWREHGRGADGGFVSLVGADGAPVPDETRRLLVQTRQLYAFSAGHALGGDEGLLGVARESFEHLLGVWHDERHGGFFHTARPGGEPLDRSKDSYDHAFVVFALAHYHRASGDARALALANECLERVRERLADPRAGGYFEAGEEDWTPRREGPRNQNPHMHWVEALLALHAASGDASLLDEARALVRLLEARWLDGARGCLLETFDADWSRLPGSARVEPGHHLSKKTLR